MTQFFTNEAVSLERSISVDEKHVDTSDEELDYQYDIVRCLKWIKEHDFKKVCLQFPDFMLADSTKIALKLQEALEQTVYVLGDTAYGSCCLDYIAAAHVVADAIIHFGPKCFSKPSGDIPSLFVHEKHTLDLEAYCEAFETIFSNVSDKILTVLDTPFIHLQETMQIRLQTRTNIITIDDVENGCDGIIVFIGANDRKLLNFKLIYKPKELHFYDEPRRKSILLYEQNSAVFRKRLYLIEKVKDSKTVGIIIGTLAVKNYLNIISRVKRLLTLHGKKYYLVSVGKPTFSKLANFPEMEVYVLIGCAMNELYDSRDFFKPIVTPYDVEIALNPLADSDFTFDFNTIANSDLSELENSELLKTSDVSLLTGSIRTIPDSQDVEETEADGTVSLRTPGTIATGDGHGASYLRQRSWKGLDRDLGQTDVKLAEEGRKGIARGYANELDL